MAIVSRKAFADPALRWFPDLRFGMFVHFGGYAQLGRGEWVQYREGIPRGDYEKLIRRFNPSRFDADAWIDVAEAGGCRYITFTAKHHDGFCMFDSDLTDYKITNTPFGRDLTGELIAACHRRGMRICLYYSQPDWHHPSFVHLRGAFKDLDNPPPDQRPDWPKYLAYCHGQVEELCTRYGRIDGIWFDGSHKSEKTWQGRKLYRMIKKHQPGAVVNERARYGDFFTPERSLPEDLTGYLFEACQSIGQRSWGYSTISPQFSIPNLVENLVRVAAKGGNFLLNVGPQPDGRIPEYQAERLAAIGGWLQTHGQAVYGCLAGEIETGSPDVVATRKGNALYLFLCRWPDTDRLIVPGLRQRPTSAQILSGGTRLRADCTDAGLEIHDLPMLPPDPSVSVIRLRFSEIPKVVSTRRQADQVPVVQLAERGRTALGVADAKVEGLGLKGSRLKVTQMPSGKPERVVTNWNAPEQRLTWTVGSPSARAYEGRILLACPTPFEGSAFVVKGTIDSIAGTVEATRSYSDYQWLTVGRIRLPKGVSRLTLYPIEMPYGYVFGHIAAMDLKPV